MDFIKLEGAGNDFILLDCMEGSTVPSFDAVRLCDRKRGIGADGVLALTNGTGADARMTIYNSDGSVPEMCGNGLRCAALFLTRKTGRDTVRIDTDAGLLRCVRHSDALFTTGMGKPCFDPAKIPVAIPCPSKEVVSRDGSLCHLFISCRSGVREFCAVSMGNPHAVSFCPLPSRADFLSDGPMVESHPYFPQKTNVEFCEVLSPRHARLIVWERGDGETLACGTGTCAAFAAGRARGLFDPAVEFELPGGLLSVQEGDDGTLFLTGPAREVFRGQITL